MEEFVESNNYMNGKFSYKVSFILLCDVDCFI